MKLVPVIYYGHTAADRRFSGPMLPWIVSEIRRTENYEKASLFCFLRRRKNGLGYAINLRCNDVFAFLNRLLFVEVMY